MQAWTTVSYLVAALSALLAAQSAIALELCEIQTLTSGGPPLSDGYGSATTMDDPYLVVGAGGDDTLGSAAGAVYGLLRVSRGMRRGGSTILATFLRPA